VHTALPLARTACCPPLLRRIKTTRAQWERNQAYNRAKGEPFKPLGMLVRPWATQYSLDDFKPANYPPGSHKRVKPPRWCKNRAWWNKQG
jgi:hypothetical protein